MKTTFIDNQQNERDLSFTVAEVFEVEMRLGVDLMDLDSIVSACQKPRDYMQLMHLLSGKEGETFVDFCKCFDGEVIDQAQTALWEAIELFSPRDRQKLIRAIVQKIRETDEEIVVKALDELTANGSGSLPEQSELIPGLTPSES